MRLTASRCCGHPRATGHQLAGRADAGCVGARVDDGRSSRAAAPSGIPSGITQRPSIANRVQRGRMRAGPRRCAGRRVLRAALAISPDGRTSALEVRPKPARPTRAGLRA